MGTITIVGLGPGAAGNLSLETMDLLKSDAQVILRTAVHPTVAELEKQNVTLSLVEAWGKGGEGATDLAEKIVNLCEQKTNFFLLYI